MTSYIETRTAAIKDEIHKLQEENNFYIGELEYLHNYEGLEESETIKRQRMIGLHKERKRVTQKILTLQHELMELKVAVSN
jgi:hypothetical protein